MQYCKKCVTPNTRPALEFNQDGICSACEMALKKTKINWKERKKNLEAILDRHRRIHNHDYDCIVPVSGGKDSIYTSIILKEKYNMHPLTCTWAPGIYTDVGWKNYNSWINYGFDNYLLTPNKKVHRLLTKLSFLNLIMCYLFTP